MSKPQSAGVAIVVGVGAGLGAAVARKFAEGYAIALVARGAEVTTALAGEIRANGGATAGVKPSPSSAAFAPAKFAVRGLAQVMARDLHPQGIHVAYVNVDSAIDMPVVREHLPHLKDEDLLKPSAIADAYWYLVHQDPSAWSHELDMRPFKEKF